MSFTDLTNKRIRAWATLLVDGKEFMRNAGNPDLIPGLGRSPGEGNGNPL